MHIGKVIIKFLLVFFCMFFLTEMLLRLFWHPTYLDPKYKRDDLGWASENVILNRYGYRDREFELVKNKDTYRIYFLGDSFTYGWYINDFNKSLPKILESDLNNGQKKVEVINASRNGFGYEEKFKRLKTDGVKFAPDVSIMAVNLDDFLEKEYPVRLINNDFIKSLRVYQFTLGNSIRNKTRDLTRQEIKKTYTNPESLEKIENNFKKYADFAKLSSIRPVLLLFPFYEPQNPNEEYKYNEYHHKIGEICQKLGIKLIDLEEKFNQIEDKNKLFLNLNDWHPSIYANEIASSFIIQKLNDEKVFDSPIFNLKVVNEKVDQGKKFELPIRILSVSPEGWSYFDDSNNEDVQDLFLPNIKDKEIQYIEDKLQTTVKEVILTHYVLHKKDLEISRKLYGYNINKVKSVSGYWRVDGNLNGNDLTTNDYSVDAGENKINLKIKDGQTYEYMKIVLEIEPKQFNIKNGVVDLFLGTSLEKPSITYLKK